MQCAKQTAPTGGPKDETPPKLKDSYPKQEQTNFKGDQIELSFNEPVQLNNPREQIIITPSVGKKFELTNKKNRVTIELNARLQENTTYSISFREAIQDITEKNPANIKLAFSTGSYIDSLSINGKVLDALTEKVAANYTVALAPASDTFNIFKHAASWLTLTDKKGFFSLENLKPGKYFLYAFDDKSKNLLVDSKNETYGFISKQIALAHNIDSLRIKTFKLDINPLKLITARTTFAYFNLRFSKSLIDYTVQAVDSTIRVYSSLEKDLTTVKLYNTIPDLDSLQVRVRAADSLNFQVDTLVYIKFPKKEATRDKLSVTLATTTLHESNSLLVTQLDFSKPITTFHPDSMYIRLDSVRRLPLTDKDYRWKNKNMSLLINKRVELAALFPPPDTTAVNLPKAKADTTKIRGSKTNASTRQPVKAKPVPTLIFAKGAFVSIEKDTAAQQTAELKLTKAESVAVIEVKVETTENFIIQILNSSEKIVQEGYNQKSAIFENLPPDTYKVRVIIDLNKNGKWDAGNFLTKTEPEPIVYYRNRKGQTDIPTKANWVMDGVLITY